MNGEKKMMNNIDLGVFHAADVGGAPLRDFQVPRSAVFRLGEGEAHLLDGATVTWWVGQ